MSANLWIHEVLVKDLKLDTKQGTLLLMRVIVL